VHPYEVYNPPVPINEITKIYVTLKMCTLYKGKPYGLAHIQYNDPESDYHSFEGLGIFTEG
jgi:hypothetical protein